MPEESANKRDTTPDFTKVGFGAMGPVEVKHDASQHTTHNHGLSPVILFAVICVLLAGFIFIVMEFRAPEVKPASVSFTTSSADGGDAVPPATPPPIVENKPAIPAKPPAIPPATAPSTSPSTPARPVIETAEVGIISKSQFTARNAFKTGELLTLRLRVSHDCRLRVIYQPAKGNPVRLFPESDAASDQIHGSTELSIPDPAKLAAHAKDATAFQVYHDTGTGPPIHEQILIQIAEEPFSHDGTTRSADSPYRIFQGKTLEEVRRRGVVKLQGLSASEAQARMDSLISERVLAISVSP